MAEQGEAEISELTPPDRHPYNNWLATKHTCPESGRARETHVRLRNGTDALTRSINPKSTSAVAISGSPPPSPFTSATTNPHGSTIMLCP